MIGTIAWATGREAVRSRSFLGLLGVYTLAVLGSRLVGWLAGTESDIVTTNVVMSLQGILGVLVAVATGSVLMHTEIQQRTLYTVLSRPLPRSSFVIGKFLGLASALLIGQVAMLVIGVAYLAISGASVTLHLLMAGLMTAIEVIVMAAIALMWTTATSPLLAAVLSLITFALGHAVHELPLLMYHFDSQAQVIVISAFASLIPNLGSLAYRNDAVYGVAPGADEWLAIVNALLWVLVLVTISIAIFRRRQL